MKISQNNLYKSLFINVLRISVFVYGAFFFSNGCKSSEQMNADARARLTDPSTRLTIRVESIPRGATIYGVQDNIMGKRLGITPMEFYYAQTEFRITGTYFDQTLDLESAKSGIFSDGHTKVAFKCFLVLPGYETVYLYKVLEDDQGIPFFSNDPEVLKGGYSRTYTIPMTLKDDQQHIQQPSQQQQQQQQQQQMMVIPDSKVPKGSVNITSTPSNAEVYIDGVFVGNSPCSLSITEGIHIIEVIQSGYISYKKELRVISESDVTIRANLNKK